MNAVVRSGFTAVVIGLALRTGPLPAQTIAANPAATCTVSGGRDVGANTDGVVVRFAASAGASPLDALTARALSTWLSHELGARAVAPVRPALAGADTGSRSLDTTELVRLLEAGERWVISGDVRESRDGVVVRWRVFDARLGREVGTGQIRDDLLWLPRLTGALLNAVGTRTGMASDVLARRSARLRTRSTPSRKAMESYLAALYDIESFDVEAQERAVLTLPKVLALDPAFAGAWFALARAEVHAVSWGDRPTRRGRSARLDAAKRAANRALALDPADVRNLALLAQIHLLRNEPLAAEQVLTGLQRSAGSLDEVSWLRAELARARGDSLTADRVVDEAGTRIGEHVPMLFLRAELERRRGRPQLACLALNRIIVLDANWAPAYVMRALVRTALGDRRGGWADAEIVSRLGRPQWGAATAALIDVSMGDVATVRRLARQQFRAEDTHTLPWLDALLRAAVFHATNDPLRARQVLGTMSCDDYRRRSLAGDPLLKFLRVPARCRVSRPPVSSE